MSVSYTDEEAVEFIKQIALTNGFNRWLGIEITSGGGGGIEAELPVTQDMLQHHGFVHGGIIGALADDVAAWAAAMVSGDVVTSSYNLQFLAPAKAPLLRGVGQVIKAGKRNVSVEAKVFAIPEDGEPKLVAVALASIAVLGVENAA